MAFHLEVESFSSTCQGVTRTNDGLYVVGAEKSSVSEDDEGSDDSEDGLPPLEKNLNHLTLQQDSDEESE